MIQPDEIRSTPVAATAAAVSGRSAGGFGHRPAVDHRHRAAQGFGRHIVEQHRVDPDIERLGKLVEGIDLEARS